MELVPEVCRCSKTFPREETYGLVAQMRRAAVSMPSNIAEAKGVMRIRSSHPSFSMHGVLSWRLETQAMIAEKLGYLGKGDATELASRSAEVGRLLNGLI